MVFKLFSLQSTSSEKFPTYPIAMYSSSSLLEKSLLPSALLVEPDELSMVPLGTIRDGDGSGSVKLFFVMAETGSWDCHHIA